VGIYGESGVLTREHAMQFVILLGVMFAAILFGGVVSLLLAWPFMWIWNEVIVHAVTVAKPISYWGAYCMALFLSVFVKSSAASK